MFSLHILYVIIIAILLLFLFFCNVASLVVLSVGFPRIYKE